MKLTSEERLALAWRELEAFFKRGAISVPDEALNAIARAKCHIEAAQPCMDATIAQMKMDGTWP